MLNELLWYLFNLYIEVTIYHYKTLNKDLNLHTLLWEIREEVESCSDDVWERIIMNKEKVTMNTDELTSPTDLEECDEIKEQIKDSLFVISDYINDEFKNIKDLRIQNDLSTISWKLLKYSLKVESLMEKDEKYKKDEETNEKD